MSLNGPYYSYMHNTQTPPKHIFCNYGRNHHAHLPIILHYYKNNFARHDASLPQTKLTFRKNNAVLEYKQFTTLLPTTVSDEGVTAKQIDTTEQQATDLSRKSVQKKLKVGIIKRENGKVQISSTEQKSQGARGADFLYSSYIL
jgi:hypothetical protein